MCFKKIAFCRKNLMMQSLIWFVNLVLAASASELFGKDRLQRSELPIASPELVQTFKLFLHKTLGSEGTYHRDFLISTGVVPPPFNYRVPRTDSSGKLIERPLTPELHEHFKKHVTDLINSNEKFDYAINRLFGERVLYLHKSLEASTSQSSQTGKTLQSDSDVTTDSIDFPVKTFPSTFAWLRDEDRIQDELILSTENPLQTTESHSQVFHLSNVENFPRASVVSLDPTIAFKTKGVAPTDNNFPTIKIEESTSYVTSDSENINFDDLSTYDNKITGDIQPEDQSSTGSTTIAEQFPSTELPFTSEYIQFLSEEPILSSHCLETDYCITKNPDAIAQILSTENYIEHLTTKHASTLSYSTLFEEHDQSSSQADEMELSNTDEFSSPEYVNPDFGKTLPVEDFELVDQTIPLSSEAYKYSVEDHFQHTQSTQNIYEVQTSESENFPHFQEEKQLYQFDAGRTAKQIHGKKSATVSVINTNRGTPGEQFPNYKEFPQTAFTCDNKMHIPGFYADQETKCQVFHVCWPQRRESFLCPIGTTFNQAILACDYWYNSNCSLSPAYFDVNTAFKEPETLKEETTRPMVDTLIKAYQRDSEIKTEFVTSPKDVSELYEADVYFSETIAKEKLSQIWKFLPIKAKVSIYNDLEYLDGVMISNS